jgi:hypothetical protein
MGLTGFDSWSNGSVSMPSVVSQARKSRLSNFSWQHQLRTCCLIQRLARKLSPGNLLTRSLPGGTAW